MKMLGDLLVGERVVDNGTKYRGKPIVWRIMEHNHQGDPDNSTAIISDKVLCLKSYDAREPKYSGSSSSANTQIQQYGNGNYGFSNLLQWANSDADAWLWYTPQHEYDHPPDTTDYVTANPYESEAGFLNGFSSGFKRNMLDVTKKIGTDVTKKIHLLTLKEAGTNYRYDDVSLSAYELFSDDASRKAEITDEAIEKDGSGYKGYWVAYNGTDYSYHIKKDGDGGNYSTAYSVDAYEGRYYGFRPYCCLKSDAMVSDSPDENGVYTLFLKSEEPDESEEEEGTPPDGKWREPKTDWVASDRFNLKDYNRIRNNLIYLNRRISNIWGEFSIEDMGNDQSSIRYIWKPKYFNAIENSLDILNEHNIVVKNYGFKQTFYQNGAFIGFAELNRIESATLQMKQIIEGWEAGLRRLSFRLGSPKGLRI